MGNKMVIKEEFAQNFVFVVDFFACYFGDK